MIIWGTSFAERPGYFQLGVTAAWTLWANSDTAASIKHATAFIVNGLVTTTRPTKHVINTFRYDIPQSYRKSVWILQLGPEIRLVGC